MGPGRKPCQKESKEFLPLALSNYDLIIPNDDSKKNKLGRKQIVKHFFRNGINY